VTFDRRRFARDNYLYLLADGEDAALVDPADPEVALELARSRGVRPRWILHTHGHADHSGGSARLRGELGAEVLGHGGDADRFAPDRDLAGVAELELGRLRLRVHPAPGHTPGSVLLEWQGKLLTGDTLFWGGCGNCRSGGDPARLAETFRTVFPRLDPRLEVHPGHDYAEANLGFVIDREPGNLAAVGRLAAVRGARSAGVEPEASDLSEEVLVNPFLRAPDEAAFLSLRGLRDRW
jgi:hydroxyacylglutathione hydrolase